MSTPPHRGDLLIATVALVDPNFQRTVVLLCEHQPQGSYGLVLNRPVRATQEMLERFPFVEDRLRIGGPVQPEVLQILHGWGSEMPGSHEVLPGVWIGADFGVLQQNVRSGELALEQCLFFLGYSGWGEGQLAGEFEADSWARAPATADLVFGESTDGLWRRAVREHGKAEPLFVNYPENPRWN